MPASLLTLREAVGVFGDVKAFEAAADDLIKAGFAPAEINMLASERTVDAKLRHRYARVEDLEDDPDAPRSSFSSVAARHGAENAFLTGLVNIGAVAGAAVVVATAGPIATAITAAIEAGGVGGLLGGAMAEWIERRQAAHLADQLEKGGLLLWVRTETEAREAEAQAILSRHGATDVHVHDLAFGKFAEAKPAVADFLKAQTDPTLVFGAPEDVLARDDFTGTQKEIVLRRWIYDAQQLERAEDEGMPGGEPGSDLLDRGLDALRTLQRRPPQGH